MVVDGLEADAENQKLPSKTLWLALPLSHPPVFLSLLSEIWLGKGQTNTGNLAFLLDGIFLTRHPLVQCSENEQCLSIY